MTVSGSVSGFYDDLAPYYHLIFEDWDSSIERQAGPLNSLLETHLGAGPLRLLDCACGIGTQAIGFARHGHRVVGSDISSSAVDRARREAALRQLDISFHVSDMTSLAEMQDRRFDVVAALDNALPHLTAAQIKVAMRAMGAALRPGGLFLASTRDYDALIVERPTVQGPAFYGEQEERRIVHQVWDWIDRERYTLHMYITRRANGRWDSCHFVSGYRCLLRAELSRALEEAGFEEIRWLTPSESGFYQPVVIARRRS
jgi:2-polyprenyl-3-methyl-5-hydroxy-6-metoxy-1,4-benzoquinol methylase